MKKLFFLLTIVSFLVISCKKDVVESGNNQMLFMSSPPAVSSPTVVDGMLCFADTADFNDYYIYLEDLCESYDDALLEFDEDSLLLIYESNFEDFTSLRSYFYDETDEIDDINDIIDVVYSHDIILNSILNDRSEVRIGSNVYVFFGSGSFYEVPSTLNTAIQTLRNTSKNEIVIIEDILLELGVELYSDKINVHFGTKTTQYENYIVPEVVFSREQCNQYKVNLECKLTARGSANPNTVDVDWSIDWGDNRTIEKNDEVVFDTEYTYPGEDGYTVEVTVTWEDYNNPGDYLTKVFTEFIKTDIVCAYYNNFEYDDDETSDNEYKLYAELSYVGFRGPFTPKGKIVAKTICYKWKSSKSKWKRNRNKCYVDLNYRFHDELCNIADGGDKKKKYKRRRKRIIRKRKWKDIEYGIVDEEIYSKHKVHFPDEDVELDLVLNPCN